MLEKQEFLMVGALGKGVFSRKQGSCVSNYGFVWCPRTMSKQRAGELEDSIMEFKGFVEDNRSLEQRESVGPCISMVFPGVLQFLASSSA